MEIVRAELADLDLLIPLFDGYRQFYQQPSDPDGARAFLEARLMRAESVIFLAHEHEIGLGFTQLYPSFSSTTMQRLWILNDLFVSPDARGRGLGEALLAAARAFAIDDDAKGLMLATAMTNTTAQRLYERSGYVRDTTFYHYNLVFGT